MIYLGNVVDWLEIFPLLLDHVEGVPSPEPERQRNSELDHIDQEDANQQFRNDQEKPDSGIPVKVQKLVHGVIVIDYPYISI